MDLFEALVLSLCISFNLRNITTCLACVTVPGVLPGDDGHGEQVGHAHPERVAHLPDAGGARALLGREPGRRDLQRARDDEPGMCSAHNALTVMGADMAMGPAMPLSTAAR